MFFSRFLYDPKNISKGFFPKMLNYSLSKNKGVISNDYVQFVKRKKSPAC